MSIRQLAMYAGCSDSYISMLEVRAIVLGREKLIESILSPVEVETVGMIRVDGYKHLFARNGKLGDFLVYDDVNGLGQLDMTTYAEIVAEARQARLEHPFHVYARYEVFQSSSVVFHKLPWYEGQP